jgi:hypothetical protein
MLKFCEIIFSTKKEKDWWTDKPEKVLKACEVLDLGFSEP